MIAYPPAKDMHMRSEGCIKTLVHHADHPFTFPVLRQNCS
jgi:hypothetical protein